VVIRDGRAHHLPRGRAAHRGHRGRRRPDGKAAILRRQLGVTEPGSGAADALEHGRRLTGIRGLRLAVRDVRAKFKYGGNVDAEHRAAVATRLAERNGPGDPAALEHLRRRTPIR